MLRCDRVDSTEDRICGCIHARPPARGRRLNASWRRPSRGTGALHPLADCLAAHPEVGSDHDQTATLLDGRCDSGTFSDFEVAADVTQPSEASPWIAGDLLKGG